MTKITIKNQHVAYGRILVSVWKNGWLIDAHVCDTMRDAIKRRNMLAEAWSEKADNVHAYAIPAV